MNQIPVMQPYFDEKEEIAAIKVLKSGWVAQGPKVTEFEELVAAHEGLTYGIATTSCTTALQLAMLAVGIKAGMDVLVPSFTFVATANSVESTGAVPVFVDVNQKTFNIDIENLEKIIKNKYKFCNDKLINCETNNELWGIVPVHQFGLCADMPRINEIARTYNLGVIEDAACALGAKIGEVHQGGFGNVSCVSFHPRKSITTGEGGMIFTNNLLYAKRMKELRAHGSSISADSRHSGQGFLLPKFYEAGFNYRMNDIQAAIGIAQLEKLDFILNERRRRAIKYNELIKDRIPEFIIPYTPEGYFHTYQSYVCMISYDYFSFDSIDEAGEFRNTLLSDLEQSGIATRQGTHAVHNLDFYVNKYKYKPQDVPNAYACDKLSITLPLYVQMSDEIQIHVVNSIRNTIDRIMERWD